MPGPARRHANESPSYLRGAAFESTIDQVGRSTLLDQTSSHGDQLDEQRLRQEVARAERQIVILRGAIDAVDARAAMGAACELRMLIATMQRRMQLPGGSAAARANASAVIARAEPVLAEAPQPPSAASIREALEGVSRESYDAELEAWRSARMARTGRAAAVPDVAAGLVPLARADASVPTGDTKTALRIDREVPIRIPGFRDATLKLRYEVAYTNKGELTSKRGADTVKLGELQRNLQAQVDGKVTPKISTSLAKLGAGLLNGGPVDIAGVPMNLSLEAKFLDAELSMDQLTLSAMKLAVVGDADLTKLFDPEKREGLALGVKTQLRLEVSVPADVAQDLYHLAQASRELVKAGEVEQRYRKAQRILRKQQKRIAELAAREGSLSAASRAELAQLRDKAKQASTDFAKLGARRDVAIASRNRMVAKAHKAAARLGKTPVGKAVSRLAAKALQTTLKRFIPLYNAVQTAKDVYEIAVFLKNARWENLFDDSSGDTLNGKGGEGPEGTGGGSESGDEAIPGTADLDARAVELTSAAKQVVDLVGRATGGASQKLDDDAKEIINRVVPADLEAHELEAVRQHMQSAGAGRERSMSEAVIDAVQKIRPDGKKQPRHTVATNAPVPKQQKPVVSKEPRRKPSTGSRTIDLEAHIRSLIALDPKTDRPHVPERFWIGDVEFSVLEQNAGRDASSGDYWLVVRVQVETAGARAQVLKGGERVLRGVRQHSQFTIRQDALVYRSR